METFAALYQGSRCVLTGSLHAAKMLHLQAALFHCLQVVSNKSSDAPPRLLKKTYILGFPISLPSSEKCLKGGKKKSEVCFTELDIWLTQLQA